jgi:5-methylcytosine-specific restriction endonuclease McrA
VEAMWMRLIHAPHETIILLPEARKNKQTYYFTGVACKNGSYHRRAVAQKKCCCPRCSEEEKARHVISRRKCLEKNRAKYNARAIEFRARKKQEINLRRKMQSHRRKAEGNPVWSTTTEYRSLEYQRRRERENLGLVAKKVRPIEKARGYSENYRCKKIDRFVERVTPSEITAIIELQGGVCVGCKKDVTKRPTIDHIIPLSKGGWHKKSNLQILCKSCNSSKRDKPFEEWAKSCLKRFNHKPELPSYFAP